MTGVQTCALPICDFIDATSGSFKYIYGFEPDNQNFVKLKENLRDIDPSRLKLWSAGLHARTGKIGFNSLGNSASAISETGNDEISLVALDDVVGEKPTYIKLDIEGAEADALYGMKNTLTDYSSKLAVSIYHKPADLWELPLLLHKLAPSYKFYMRHYTHDLNETVCYAV